MSSRVFRSPLPYAALVISHVIWGLNFVVAKVTLQEFPVMSLGFLRFAIAFVLLLPFLYVERKIKIKTKDLPRFVLAGVCLVTIHIALFYEGIKRTSAIDASVISLSVPIISVTFGWIFLKEKLYWINLVGTILGFLGTIVIVGVPLLFLGIITSNILIGNTLLLISSVFYVIGAFTTKVLLKDYSPVQVTAWLFLVATIGFLIPAGLDLKTSPGWFSSVTIIGFLGFLFIVFLSTVSAFVLFDWGVKKVGVIQADLVQYLEPAVTAAVAVPFLAERVSYSFIVGTVLIVLGVYWGTLGKKDHSHFHLKHHRS